MLVCEFSRIHSGGAQFMKPWPRLIQSGGTFAGLRAEREPTSETIRRDARAKRCEPHVKMDQTSSLSVAPSNILSASGIFADRETAILGV